jgi:hypothetical protein
VSNIAHLFRSPTGIVMTYPNKRLFAESVPEKETNMTDQANKTPIVETKPVTTPEPGNVADTAKAPVAVVEPAKAV